MTLQGNKIEGAPILKLATMVKRLKVKKNSEKSEFEKNSSRKFVAKIRPQNSNSSLKLVVKIHRQNSSQKFVIRHKNLSQKFVIRHSNSSLSKIHHKKVNSRVFPQIKKVSYMFYMIVSDLTNILGEKNVAKHFVLFLPIQPLCIVLIIRVLITVTSASRFNSKNIQFQEFITALFMFDFNSCLHDFESK